MDQTQLINPSLLPISIPSSNTESMDWHSWLSKSNLDPAIVYQLSLLFSSNELGRDDISHFDHEFLQSMGISIAKHRIEILKLAKKDKRFSRSSRPVARLLAAVKRVVTYVHSSLSRRDSSAIVIVPRPAKRQATRRWKRQARQGRVALLTDGGAKAATPVAVRREASPLVYRLKENSGGGEEMRWISMFKDLRPT